MPDPATDDDLRLLTVHAHPDDEASKGAATVHRYAREGLRCVLVCATGGEEGEILNPAMERPEVQERLAEVRIEELQRSAGIIGYHEVVMLGYRDSGMAGSEANGRPEAFAAAELDEAVGRLVAVIRRERPQVIVTYADDQEGYPHPDHLKVHDISVVAFDAAADPDAYPDAGAAWQPSKLYYSAWTKARLLALHDKFVELGLESPFTEEWLARPGLDARITTRIEVRPEDDVRDAALLAHATQVDPASPFWFGLPPEAANTYPYDDYILARSLVDGAAGGPVPEDDLFAGLREPVRPGAGSGRR